MRLYRRGSLPDSPRVWLITVALNLFRNARSTRRRRLWLLTPDRGAHAHADPVRPPDESVDASATRERVRAALDALPERERRLLLLHAEGYRYREIAAALVLNEASVGTLLARARRVFRAQLKPTMHLDEERLQRLADARSTPGRIPRSTGIWRSV